MMEFRLEIVISCDSVRSKLVISTWHVMMHEFKSEYLIPEEGHTVQGCTLWCAPGSVNMRRENCVLLPAAARRTQFFHILITKPGRSPLSGVLYILHLWTALKLTWAIYVSCTPAIFVHLFIVKVKVGARITIAWLPSAKPSSSIVIFIRWGIDRLAE